MRPEEFGEFAGEIGNDHRGESFALLKVDVNSAPDAADDSTDFMSVRFVYVESPEDLFARNLKAVRFWVPKEEAIAYAAMILNAATRDEPSVPPPIGRPN